MRKVALVGAAAVVLLAGALYVVMKPSDPPAAAGGPVAIDTTPPSPPPGPELPNPVQLRFSYKPVAEAQVPAEFQKVIEVLEREIRSRLDALAAAQEGTK